ncbi:hypothetical protein ACFL0J_05330 [Candidatus Neomarinimicrobiota bacterium]
MARAPIIISNGGVVSLLAKNCAGKSEEAVANQIKINADELNIPNKKGIYKTKVVVIKKAQGNNKIACLYWRLTEPDTPLGQNQGEEGVTINKIIDDEA